MASNFKYDPYKEYESVKNYREKSSTYETAAEDAIKMLQQGTSYSQSAKDSLNKVLNRKPFEYDMNGDALYQQYKNQYTELGKNAMKDTVAQAADLTGGYGNSYGVTAGNQAYQSYLGKVNEMVPKLYQLALDRYNNETQQLMNNYSLLSNADETEYSRLQNNFANLMEQAGYYAGRGDTLSSEGYNQWLNNTNLAFSVDSENLNRSNTDVQSAKSDVYAAVQAGVMPSDALLKAAGLEGSKTQLQAMANVYSKKLKPTTSSSGGSSSSGSGSVYGSGGGNGSGGVDGSVVTVTSGVPEIVYSKASSFSNNADLANYLDGLTASGVITEETADSLYAQYKTPDKASLNKRSWTLVDDGGINWLGGIDENAIVKDQYDNKYRLDKLFDALVSEGMTEDDAETYVINLQKQLGA